MPCPVLPAGERFPSVDLTALKEIPQNQMFDLREALDRFQVRNPDAAIYDACQGDGGASLPGVPGDILEEAYRLLRAQGTSYDKPHGDARFWTSVVEDYWKMDAFITPKNVVACQGGRDALLKAFDAMLALGHGRMGDYIVLSRVPWVSYNWGPYMVGANVLLAPGEEQDAWRMTPEGIASCVEFAKRDGRGVAGIVITSPDNPTGRSLTLAEQLELIRAAFSAGIPFVLLDWIYHYVTDGEPYNLNDLLRALPKEDRGRVIIMDGITKSLGGSNIRNAHLIASEQVVGFTKRRASHGVIPGFFGMAVAVAAYRQGFAKACRSITEPTSESRAWLRQALQEKKVRHIIDQGYYAFLDISQWLNNSDLKDSAAMGMWLAGEHGIAIVPGSFFSPFADQWVRFSYAQKPETTRRVFNKLVSVLETSFG